MERSGWRRAASVDALLYGASAVFAGSVAVAASIPQYREWGRIACGVYAGGFVAAMALRGMASLRVRAWLAAAVFLGAGAVPLALEATWRSRTGPGFHAQSEVLVTEEAARAFLDGRDPYAATFLHGSLAARPLGTKTHFPYLPGMVAFGVPRALDGRSPFADARVWFAAAAIASLAAAARTVGTTREDMLRCGQALLILPTGALPLATGGDDLPVLSLMLLSVMLIRRGRLGASGLMAGLAASIKQAAWPLLPFLLVAASPRRPRFAIPTLGVALAVVIPFVAWGPAAFVEDAIRFPLGLGRQPSAAGTPTVGTFLVHALPFTPGVVTAALAATVAALALWLLTRPSTRTVRGAVRNAGFLYLVGIVLAPSARAGYLLYPLNLLVWAWVVASEPPRGPTAKQVVERTSP